MAVPEDVVRIDGVVQVELQNNNLTGPPGPPGPQGEPGVKGDPGDSAIVPPGTLYGLNTADERNLIPANSPEIGFTFYAPPGQVLLAAYSWVQVGSNAPGTVVDAGCVVNATASFTTNPTSVMVIAWNRTNQDGEMRTCFVYAHKTADT